MEESFLFLSATDEGFFRGTKQRFIEAINKTWPTGTYEENDGSINAFSETGDMVGEFYVYSDNIRDIPEKLE